MTKQKLVLLLRMKYIMNQRDLFPGFDVDCFMRKPIENEDLIRNY